MTDLFLISHKAPFRERSESGHTGGKLKKKNNIKGNKKNMGGRHFGLFVRYTP